MDRADIRKICADSYARHKNLHLVGAEVGIPWQTVYVHLRKAGVAVTGDKTRYGSDRDRLSAAAEAEFARLVPAAENQNAKMFQAPMDFLVWNLGVDIKASLLHKSHVSATRLRWSFSMKKQEMAADFIVCFAYYERLGNYDIFLLPGELIRKFQTVSIPVGGKSKWAKYRIAPDELAPFFASVTAEG